MAFSTPSKPTSIFFTIAVGLLVFLAMASSAAPTVNKRQVAYPDQNITKQRIYWSMKLLAKIDKQGTIEARNLTSDNLKVLCSFYDLYMDYATVPFAIQSDNPLHANYDCSQYVAWEAMQSARQWVNISNSTIFPPEDGYTLSSIATTCQNFRFNGLINLAEDVRSLTNERHEINATWIKYLVMDYKDAYGAVADVINGTVASS